MAITGIPVIAPASAAGGTRHRMSNLAVQTPSGQDGVWSAPTPGTAVSRISVQRGEGTNMFAFRIGADGNTNYGQYSDITIDTCLGSGVWLTRASRCQISQLIIDRARRHGINIDLFSDQNVFDGIMFQRPSLLASNVYDAIHVTDSDNNSFNGIVFQSNTVDHKNTCDFSGGSGNRLDNGGFTAGKTGMFLETAVGDNDFGMDVIRFTISGTSVVGSHPVRIYAEVYRQVYACRVVANTAPTGADLIMDVNKNGSTIFTTAANRPKIVIAAFVGAWAIPDRITLVGTQILKGSYLSVDIDQIGSTVAGADLTVEIMWRKE